MSEGFLERPTLHSQQGQREPFPPGCPERKGFWPSWATTCRGQRGGLSYTVPSHHGPSQITADTLLLHALGQYENLFTRGNARRTGHLWGSTPVPLPGAEHRQADAGPSAHRSQLGSYLKGTLHQYTDVCKNKGKQAVHVSPDQYWPCPFRRLGQLLALVPGRWCPLMAGPSHFSSTRCPHH